MKEIAKEFIDAKAEFLKSNGSEKSVEELYDIIYFLEDVKKPTFEEEFILAKIYNMVGSNIFASKIIDKSLEKSNMNMMQIAELKELKSEIDGRDIWNVKIYRDLRDSKIKKDPTKLIIEDFVISQTNSGSYDIKISEKIKNIVILNKNVPNEAVWGDEACFIFSDKKPDLYILLLLSEYIIWLGQVKDEILDFYNGADFRDKLRNVSTNWFDGLKVSDFYISIDENDNFDTQIILHDYLQNDYGFRLKIENFIVKQIEYDPIL
ncbi:hypothetical protein SAMN05444671_3757 [Flavobacterium sp. CF108]|uniref:hypothetical protein n=1 Tax=unclassified Flavobacterium TaxID=196869 RepID=UPI0008D44907|nr:MULTISPECIES: hypothetical protein [unclassified Flavobacterium]SEO55306.1 hypothetical protein SAMN04487978_3190 [Flavobacterium sp. fv08]SHH75951.1 hypothetical protein SAMN05444671_3757 [Flavobacterium sp. CF108]